MKNLLFLVFVLFFNTWSYSQVINQRGYSEADSLRGSLRAERAYEVLKYHLQVRVDPEERFISGFNTISFKAEENLPVIQIDLFENMRSILSFIKINLLSMNAGITRFS